MYLLLNSAMMPAPGRYHLRPMTAEQFGASVRAAQESGKLDSYIGYEQTAAFVSRLSGVVVPVNRAQATVMNGDTLLIVRLRYRPDAPTKGASVKEDDFEFFLATYHSED